MSWDSPATVEEAREHGVTEEEFARILAVTRFGQFHFTNRPVADVLAERIGNTILLIGLGQVLAIILGVIFGLFAAWRARTAITRASFVSATSRLAS